jgi:hypothetical protein
VRFKQFLSDVGEGERKKWDCEYCQERLLMSARNCPLGLTSSDFKEDASTENIATSNPLVARKKYGFGQIAKKRDDKIAESEESQEGITSNRLYIIKHGDFEFTECPVPILADSLMCEEDRFANLAVNIVNMCENTHSLPLLAGAMDQTNIYYECRIVVLSEQNKIEQEKHEEQTRKSKADAERNKRKGKKG